MLNPLAHDYTPISTILSPEENHKPKGNRPPRQRDQNKKSSSQPPHPQKSNKKQVQSRPSQATVENKSDNKQDTTNSHSKANKRRDSQANSTSKKQQPQEKGASKRRPKTSQQIDSLDVFAQESKFITVEAAIDPVHRVDPPSFQIPSSSRRQSSGNLHQFEHGYERYIDWVRE